MSSALPSCTLQTKEPVRRYITEDGKWLRALDKARALPHKVWRVGERYRVHSASAPTLWHYLRFDARLNDWVCDCYAAQSHNPCWHRGALELRLQREYRAPRLSDYAETDYELFDAPLLAA